MHFTLRQIQYFVAAGEAGSIKLAAEALSISQPSISSAIAHLENELQLKLFVRHHAQGMTLTATGVRFMRECKLLVRQARALQNAAMELRDEVSGELTFGCMVTLAPLIAPELIRTFTNDNAEARLSIIEGSHDELLRKLRQVEVDVAISYNLVMHDDMQFEPLVDLPPHVLVPRQHPLAGQPCISLQELEKHPMVLLDLPRSASYFMGLFQDKGLSPNVAMRCTDMEVLRSLVANGFGYGITNIRPRRLAASDGRELALIPLSGRHRSLCIGLATMADDSKPSLLRAFEEHCRSTIRPDHIPGMLPDRSGDFMDEDPA